ncbi:hypothetical protein [Oscillatoria sp. FACHB-1406]|uniref:hypothetical protein n=1 Tax=Oscillatoria sp. FACHB-1406 TaxID=2692846 RepID=UPI00168202CB|nr:hypothetical protein [Oscillatoria sp. FACHB-1406]MBD2580175.1 hypothetical protein [Oscillatoria sp. FACHB-1406]
MLYDNTAIVSCQYALINQLFLKLANVCSSSFAFRESTAIFGLKSEESYKRDRESS